MLEYTAEMIRLNTVMVPFCALLFFWVLTIGNYNYAYYKIFTWVSYLQEKWFIELLLKLEQLFEASKALSWILFSSVLYYINFACFPKSGFSKNLFLVLC